MTGFVQQVGGSIVYVFGGGNVERVLGQEGSWYLFMVLLIAFQEVFWFSCFVFNFRQRFLFFSLVIVVEVVNSGSVQQFYKYLLILIVVWGCIRFLSLRNKLLLIIVCVKLYIFIIVDFEVRSQVQGGCGFIWNWGFFRVFVFGQFRFSFLWIQRWGFFFSMVGGFVFGFWRLFVVFYLGFL